MDGEKTQPQELLEELLPREEPQQYPTYEEQKAYWDEKLAAENKAEVDPDTFKCMTCDPPRKFKQAQGLRMHVARVHTKTILAPNEQPLYDYPPTDEQLRKTHTKRLQPEPVGRPVGTLDTRRKKWSLKRRRAFNAKRKAIQQSQSDDTMIRIAKNDAIADMIRIAKNDAIADLQQPDVIFPTLNYCPHCGENVSGWRFQP